MEQSVSDVLIVPRIKVKAIKDHLKEKSHLDASKKIISTSRDRHAIAITSEAKEVFSSGRVPEGCVLSTMVLSSTTAKQPYQLMRDAVLKLLPHHSTKQFPRHWIRHGDLIVLPSNSFSDVRWDDNVKSEELWDCVSKALGVKRLAIEDHICNDAYRTPTCHLLLGDSGLVEHVDNKVRYVFDVTKNMFCHGNITEKIRMSQLPCENEIVLDLFAGIGYFTLPLLVHTSAKRVHACDWSADAIEALHKGLFANRVAADRCVVHCSDCRKLQLIEPVDRVILGLIPSSQCGYKTACLHINPSSGGWLHIHGTVNSKPVPMVMVTKTQCWNNWGQEVCKEINDLLCGSHDHTSWITRLSHVEHVKSYAPHIDHIVVDIECRRSN